MRQSIVNLLVEVGMIPSQPNLVKAGTPEFLTIVLDGRVIGYLSSSQIEKVVGHLRRLKVSADSGVCFVYCF